LHIVLSIFVNNILPVFLIIGTGALLGVTIKPDIKSVSRTTFYALTPCIVFSSLTNARLGGSETGTVVLFAVLATLATAMLAWLLATVLGWEGKRRRALILPILVVNSGNFGLSVVLFAFGSDAQARAMVYFVTTASMASTLGVILAAGGRSWQQALRNILRIPMLYAVIAAIAVMVLGDRVQLPGVLTRPIDLLGSAAVPLMLVILGMQLVQSVQGLRGRLAPILLATAFRLLIAPLVAVPLAWLTGISGVTYRACMLEASMPAGVTSAILALEYDLEPEAVTSTIFVSTLLSALTLSILISLVR
jgi:predicted permease